MNSNTRLLKRVLLASGLFQAKMPQMMTGAMALRNTNVKNDQSTQRQGAALCVPRRCLAPVIGALLLLAKPAAAADPIAFSVGAYHFERPEGWTWVVPTSTMRKAELSVPGEKAPAEVTFFHFGPSQGGGVDNNVARWLSQFSEPMEELQPVVETGLMGQVRITFVRAQGTFQSGMPGQPTTPMPGYALHGAILEDPVNGDVFVKMTGPQNVVTEAGEAFEAMVKDAATTTQPRSSLSEDATP